MSFSRAERRREAALRRSRVDPACSADLVREIDVKLAASLAGKHLTFCRSETVADVLARECPDLFAFVEGRGFVLSFAVPENTPQALGRGVIGYTVRRKALN
jgi:hypothetical protein